MMRDSEYILIVCCSSKEKKKRCSPDSCSNIIMHKSVVFMFTDVLHYRFLKLCHV